MVICNFSQWQWLNMCLETVSQLIIKVQLLDVNESPINTYPSSTIVAALRLAPRSGSWFPLSFSPCSVVSTTCALGFLRFCLCLDNSSCVVWTKRSKMSPANFLDLMLWVTLAVDGSSGPEVIFRAALLWRSETALNQPCNSIPTCFSMN